MLYSKATTLIIHKQISWAATGTNDSDAGIAEQRVFCQEFSDGSRNEDVRRAIHYYVHTYANNSVVCKFYDIHTRY